LYKLQPNKKYPIERYSGGERQRLKLAADIGIALLIKDYKILALIVNSMMNR